MKNISLLSIGRLALSAVIAYEFLNFIDNSDLIIESFETGLLEGFLGK